MTPHVPLHVTLNNGRKGGVSISDADQCRKEKKNYFLEVRNESVEKVT